jgi:hypothetical protein
MHDGDDEPTHEDEHEHDVDDVVVEDENAHTLSIRRADGEELLTVFSPTEEWSAYLAPGGAVTNAYIGTPGDPIVWVDAVGRPVERDDDGTYVIHLD